MKQLATSVILAIAAALGVVAAAAQEAPAGYSGMQTEITPFRWPSKVPDGCPFPPSETLAGVEFTGRYRNYTNADTWYPTWADDGNLYSPWTDGYLLDNGDKYIHFQREGEFAKPEDPKFPKDCYPCNSGNNELAGRPNAATGQAKIVGDDPMNLQVINLAPRIEADPAPYIGRYPCGSLCHNGVWYFGTYSIWGPAGLGPFVGFRHSSDSGKTWVQTTCTPSQPLFGEDPAKAPVKIGAPHFVDFGKNMQHSPDGKAYLVAHGSTRREAPNEWQMGDHVYLARVTPSPATINDAKAYEFFAGYNAEGKAQWSNEFGKIKPLLTWEGRLGIVTASYVAPLRKFLMFISRATSLASDAPHDTMILEADAVDGPWKLAEYLPAFGPNAYFVNLPTKFISKDGLTGWLCYSSCWDNKVSFRPGNPPGSHYAMSLHEVRLLPRVIPPSGTSSQSEAPVAKDPAAGISPPVPEASATPAAAALSWRRTGTSLALVRGSNILWQAVADPAQGKPYFHPLATPGGVIVSDLRPVDHLWHRGLWWSWKLINGLNYWEEDPKTGRSEAATELLNWDAETRPDGSARLTFALSYHPWDGTPVLTEKRVVEVSAPTEKGYTLDWVSEFTAATDVVLDRSPAGYAGFSLRLGPEQRKWTFTDSEGHSGQPAIHGQPASWVKLSAGVDSPAVAIFDHLENLRHPARWYVDQSMPYFSPAPLFERPFEMAAGKTLDFRYRVLVTDQDPGEANMNVQAGAFKLQVAAAKLARPTPEQVAWHEQERIMFIHFGVATWEGTEYDADGTTDLSKLNPDGFDAEEVCRIAQSWGAKQILLVAKHVGGFCWWPTATTDYCVRSIPWQNGKGNLVKEVAEACRRHGLSMGIYLYPDDVRFAKGIGCSGRTDDPAKQEEWNRLFRQQWTEVLTLCGPDLVREVWLDGGCSIALDDILKKLAPQAVVFQGRHANIRWVGNEQGTARDPNWNTLMKADLESGVATDAHSAPEGDAWAPVECDVTLYDHNWFWNPDNERKRRSTAQLMNLYVKSVGRGSVLLLNSTPSTSGRYPQGDVAAYQKFGEAIERNFGHPVAVAENLTGAAVELDLGGVRRVNCSDVWEEYALGHRIREYVIEGRVNGNWTKLVQGTAVGRRKLDLFAPVMADRLRLRVLRSVGDPVIRKFQAHQVDDALAGTHLPAMSQAAAATSSTAHSAPYAAKFLVDGDPQTRWSAADGDSDPWVELDLGRPRKFARIAASELADRVRAFRVEARNATSEAWRTVFEGERIGQDFHADFERCTARYVRLYVTRYDGPAPTLWEFQLDDRAGEWETAGAWSGPRAAADLSATVNEPAQYDVRFVGADGAAVRILGAVLLLEGEAAAPELVEGVGTPTLRINRSQALGPGASTGLRVDLDAAAGAAGKIQIRPHQ
jgi:alpha-L-fucosidase